MKILTALFWLVLIFISVFIWRLELSARILEYDDNVGALILGFLLSCLVTLALAVLWFTSRAFIKNNKLIIAIFLITTSPLTLVIADFYYPDLFGPLKNA